MSTHLSRVVEVLDVGTDFYGSSQGGGGAKSDVRPVLLDRSSVHDDTRESDLREGLRDVEDEGKSLEFWVSSFRSLFSKRGSGKKGVYIYIFLGGLFQ